MWVELGTGCVSVSCSFFIAMPEHLTSQSLFLFITFTVFFCFSCLQSSGHDQNELQLIDGETTAVQSGHSSPTGCDFAKGKWVHDETYPLYDAACSYLSTAVACRKNGRPDSDYEKWKWKPDSCSIPRFDALEFLGKMRRKRIMLVGDSIMRNQWESLVCLVESVVPKDRKTVIFNGPTMSFLALDFELSIEFCWAPFLVELRRGEGSKRILHLDLIEENAKYWRGVDVLLFDSAHWWTHSTNWSSWDFVMEGENVYKNMNPMVAYKKGLVKWAEWIDLNLDPRRIKVFFRSMSPMHNRENGWKCHDEKAPFEAFNQPLVHVGEPLLVLRRVVRKMMFPVYVQDITGMSFLRKDGHPSIYGRALGEKNERLVKDHGSDCSHWCLPGVPDTWNEILSAML